MHSNTRGRVGLNTWIKIEEDIRLVFDVCECLYTGLRQDGIGDKTIALNKIGCAVQQEYIFKLKANDISWLEEYIENIGMAGLDQSEGTQIEGFIQGICDRYVLCIIVSCILKADG